MDAPSCYGCYIENLNFSETMMGLVWSRFLLTRGFIELSKRGQGLAVLAQQTRQLG